MNSNFTKLRYFIQLCRKVPGTELHPFKSVIIGCELAFGFYNPNFRAHIILHVRCCIVKNFRFLYLECHVLIFFKRRQAAFRRCVNSAEIVVNSKNPSIPSINKKKLFSQPQVKSKIQLQVWQNCLSQKTPQASLARKTEFTSCKKFSQFSLGLLPLLHRCRYIV